MVENFKKWVKINCTWHNVFSGKIIFTLYIYIYQKIRNKTKTNKIHAHPSTIPLQMKKYTDHYNKEQTRIPVKQIMVEIAGKQ